MHIKTFVFNPFFENTYVLSDDEGNALIVDPGCYEKAEFEELDAYLKVENLTPVAIINTHCHIDHVLGNDGIKAKYGIELWVPTNEEEVLRSIPAYAPSYGFTNYKEADVDHWYDEGEMSFKNLKFKAIEVPGHSPGHMIFLFSNEKVVIGGDVLFRESIGRTDLPGGNHDDLLRNIKERVYTLKDDIVVYPGHGPETTIGHEKMHNPFVKA